MKAILIIAALIGGCASRDYVELTSQVGNGGLERFDDKKKDVSCYIYRDHDGSLMQCMHLNR